MKLMKSVFMLQEKIVHVLCYGISFQEYIESVGVNMLVINPKEIDLYRIKICKVCAIHIFLVREKFKS